MEDTDTSAHLNPPKQERSQQTLERIVAASLELLATEGPAGLTVHKVVEKADSSVGSFYARFKGKDDLLDYLGDRIWTEALERWTDALDSRDWSELSLGEMVEGAVGLLIDAQRSRSAYLRALDWAAEGPNVPHLPGRAPRGPRRHPAPARRRDDASRSCPRRAPGAPCGIGRRRRGVPGDPRPTGAQDAGDGMSLSPSRLSYRGVRLPRERGSTSSMSGAESADG